MADRVDTAKHRIQPAQREPMPDGPVTQAYCPELSACDDSMLSSRQCGDPALNPLRLSFGLYFGLNLRHVWIEASAMCRVARDDDEFVSQVRRRAGLRRPRAFPLAILGRRWPPT
jgi:hypothetical protein